MRPTRTLALTSIVALTMLILSGAAQAGPYVGRVSGLPTVQTIGAGYPFTLTVVNKGPWVKFFCIDFNDDDGSWLFKGPAAMTAYPKSDGFCTKLLKKGTRKFRFLVVPAKPGSHTLEVIFGKGHLYSAINKVLVDDEDALSWSSEFVLH